MKWWLSGRLVFDGSVVICFAWITYEASQFRSLAGYFPLGVGSLGVVLGVLNFALGLRRLKEDFDRSRRSTIDQKSGDELEPVALEAVADGHMFATIRYLAWIVGYVSMIWFMGMLPASGIFLAAFLTIEAKVGWLFSLLAAAAASFLLLILVRVLDFAVPAGALFQ